MQAATYLTAEQVVFYHQNGYLVIPEFWSEATIGQLKSKIESIIQEADLTAVTSVFTTQDNIRHSDEYFLTSGLKIRFFWEEKARNCSGEFLQSEKESINKIGHGLHDLDPDFQAVSYDGRIGSICVELGLVKPLAVQSMYIFKQARIGAEVVPHQDGAFLYTDPQSCLGFWWPLDDCSLENGCLWAVPGSHMLGVHRRFRRRDHPHEGTEFVPAEPMAQWDVSQAVPLEIPKGSLVVLHNALVHFSNENHSNAPRHAYSIHVVDGRPGVEYPADNWLQRPIDAPFREITARHSDSN